MISKKKVQQRLRLSNIDQHVSKKRKFPLFKQASKFWGPSTIFLRKTDLFCKLMYICSKNFFNDLASQLFVRVLRIQGKVTCRSNF